VPTAPEDPEPTERPEIPEAEDFWLVPMSPSYRLVGSTPNGFTVEPLSRWYRLAKIEG